MQAGPRAEGDAGKRIGGLESRAEAAGSGIPGDAAFMWSGKPRFRHSGRRSGSTPCPDMDAGRTFVLEPETGGIQADSGAAGIQPWPTALQTARDGLVDARSANMLRIPPWPLVPMLPTPASRHRHLVGEAAQLSRSAFWCEHAGAMAHPSAHQQTLPI